MMDFFQVLQTRRSIYAIGDQAMVPYERLLEVLKVVIEATPSAFNSQSQRMVLLRGDAHLRFWQIVIEALRTTVSEKQRLRTERKIAAFAAGYGTLLFFDDQEVTNNLKRQFPQYQDNFGIWYQQHAGMLQINIWNALADLGYGASLQHYNELIEPLVQQTFKIPNTWQLLAQMPFGNIVESALKKDIMPFEKRFKIIE